MAGTGHARTRKREQAAPLFTGPTQALHLTRRAGGPGVRRRQRCRGPVSISRQLPVSSSRKGALMTTSVSSRLSAAAFIVLTLPVLASGVGRCAGQDTGRGVEGPDVRPGADEAQRAADRKAGGRVLAASVRAALIVLYDPDEAYQLLKTVRDETFEDPDLSEACRKRLESQLEWAFWGVWHSGVFIKEQQIEWLVVKAELRACLDRWRCQLERGKRQLALLLGTQ